LRFNGTEIGDNRYVVYCKVSFWIRPDARGSGGARMKLHGRTKEGMMIYGSLFARFFDNFIKTK
jgi:hypothetical protein